MAFDFDNIPDDNTICANQLKFQIFFRHISEFIKANASLSLYFLQNRDIIEYNPNTNIIKCDYYTLGIIYNSITFKQGLSLDVLNNFKYQIGSEKPLYYAHEIYSIYNFLPFINSIPGLYILSATAKQKYYNIKNYNKLNYPCIIDIVSISDLSCKFFINISYVTNYIKYIIGNIVNYNDTPAFISFVPFIHEYVSKIFDVYNDNDTWSSTLKKRELNISKFINYNSGNLECYFINPIDDLISFIEYCASINAKTDCLTLLMFVQSIYKAKAYKVQDSCFNFHFNKLTSKLLKNSGTLYHTNLYKVTEYTILYDFLKKVNVL